MSEALSADRAERLIAAAAQAGVFDDLPGEGRPIPGAGRPDDVLWWVRSWMQRNDLQAAQIQDSGVDHPEGATLQL